jgi:putative transposase
VLVFIHLGSRRVFASPATYHPDSDWVIQQARNASMWMEEKGIAARWINATIEFGGDTPRRIVR